MAVRTKRFIGKKKSCSCSMPGVWRAAAFCDGALVIFHSPRACAHVARSMDINSHYRALAAGSRETRMPVPLLSSQLEEKHSIFGGAERLQQCIDFAVSHYSPSCIVIASSCVAGVIGDDVEAAGREAERRFGIPVVTVSTCGFLDGEYYEGYFETAMRMAERFLKPQPHIRNTALLLGDNGGPWGHYASEVTRMLNFLGVEVIGQFPGYVPFAELPQITRAQASVILGGRGQTHFGLTKLAAFLQDKYGIEYSEGVYPVGWEQTVEWIRQMGELYGCGQRAEELILQEQRRLETAVAGFLPVTAGKKTVICIGRWLMYFHPANLLKMAEMLQLEVTGIILLPGYDAREKELMTEAIHGCTGLPLFDTESGGRLVDEAELVLTTHELQGKDIRQIFIPMLPQVGAAGEVDFMQAVYRALCSRHSGGGVIYV